MDAQALACGMALRWGRSAPQCRCSRCASQCAPRYAPLTAPRSGYDLGTIQCTVLGEFQRYDPGYDPGYDPWCDPRVRAGCGQGAARVAARAGWGALSGASVSAAGQMCLPRFVSNGCRKWIEPWHSTTRASSKPAWASGQKRLERTGPAPSLAHGAFGVCVRNHHRLRTGSSPFAYGIMCAGSPHRARARKGRKGI